MPRKRQTQTGEDAQTIESVPGQRYGEGKEQQALQQAMPAPDVPEIAPSAASAAAAAAPQPQAPQQDPAALQQYLGSTPRLLGGSQSPDEPVTAGLSSGPGVGPNALSLGRSTTPLARYMNNLAQETGNSKWQRLAERAGL